MNHSEIQTILINHWLIAHLHSHFFKGDGVVCKLLDNVILLLDSFVIGNLFKGRTLHYPLGEPVDQSRHSAITL